MCVCVCVRVHACMCTCIRVSVGVCVLVISCDKDDMVVITGDQGGAEVECNNNNTIWV